MLFFLLRVLLFCFVCCLTACVGGDNYAPIVDRMTPVGAPPASHIVSRGETLFSISWRYGMDFKGLAITNGVVSPYTIFPGQKIILKSSPVVAKATVSTPQKAAANSLSKSRVAMVPAVKPPPVKAVVSPPAAVAKSLVSARWQWPVKGKLLTAFSSASAVHKGIDLHGILGEPVHAANGGKVVYAGSGLVGYGKLLIIKHDERFLSAYGHNRSLLVKEGDLVKVGQQIAEVGDTGTDKVKLHFEVRRDGKPIDPLTLLKQSS